MNQPDAKIVELLTSMDDLLIAYANASPEKRRHFHETLRSCGISAGEAGANLAACMKSALA
jgi:hypothetical protein